MKYSLLVIDSDDISYARLEQKVKESEPQSRLHRVMTFDDAKEQVKDLHPAVIISEFDKNEISNYHFLSSIKDVPIIFISSNAKIEQAIKAIKLGAFDFLTKDPKFNYIEELPLIVEKALLFKSERKKLEQIEKRYYEIFSKTNDLIQSTTPEGYFDFVNPSWLSALGYKHEEISTLNFETIVLPSTLEPLRKKLCQLKVENDFVEVEFGLLNTNGETVYVEGPVSLDFNNNRLAILRDVTKRKVAEQKIKDSEKHYRLLVEESSEVFYKTDYEGNFTYINEVSQDFCGYPKEDLIGKPFLLVIPKEHRQKVVEFYKQQFLDRIESTYCEFPIITKNGEKMWIGQNVRAILDNNRKDYIIGFSAVVRNVTERISYENELKQLSLVARYTDNYVIITDKYDRIEWVNDAFENITGYKFDEVVNKEPSMVLRGSDTDSAIGTAIYQTVQIKGKTFIGEILNYTKSGKEIWLSLTVTPIINNRGEVEKYITIGNDVSDMKNVEEKIRRQNRKLEEQNFQIQKTKVQLQETNEKLLSINNHLEEIVGQRTKSLKNTNERLVDVNKELDLYVYRASHDLRGPLASLLGLTNIAKIESKEPVAIEYLNRIQDCTLNLENILRKLLSVSKVKKHQIEMSSIKVNHLFEDILKSYKNFIKAYNIQILFEYDSSIEIYTDQYLLTTILQNVIENAIYFRKDHRNNMSHQVKVSYKCDGDRNVFEIEDNGIGIDEVFKDRIFEMFFRVSEKSKGNGLGLFISWLATKRLSGDLDVISQHYKFSKFMLTLPQKENSHKFSSI